MFRCCSDILRVLRGPQTPLTNIKNCVKTQLYQSTSANNYLITGWLFKAEAYNGRFLIVTSA